MLSKLLKYDFRANIKVFLFIWPGMVLLAAVNALIFSFADENPALAIFGLFTMLLFLLVLIGAVAFAFVFCVIRFYSGLLGREGYLMFTLPTKPWKLLTSKLISGVTIVVVTTLTMFLSLFILLSGVAQMVGGNLWEFGSIEISWIPILLSYLVGAIREVLMIYMACCIGHLFRKHRILWSVLVYYGMSIVLQILSMSLLAAFAFNSLSYFERMNTSVVMDQTVLFTLPLDIVLSALFFFLCERILRKKLNLE